MDLENNVSCSLCTLDFTGMNLDISQFKQLSCKHIFCKKCFNDLIKHFLKQNPGQKLDLKCPTCRAPQKIDTKLDFLAKPPIVKPSNQYLYNWAFSGPCDVVLKSFAHIATNEEGFIKEALITLRTTEELGIAMKLSKKMTENNIKSILFDGIQPIQGEPGQVNFTFVRIEMMKDCLFSVHLKKKQDIYADFCTAVEDMKKLGLL